MIKAYKVKSFGGSQSKNGFQNYIYLDNGLKLFVTHKQYVDVNIYDVVCYTTDENGEYKLTKVFKDISSNADLRYKEMKNSKIKFKAFEVE